jgi:hypothetical protein
MKTVTVERFLGFDPCYPESRIREIAGDRKEWDALGIPALAGVPAEDRLWAVLREELTPAPILHEFACRCAERVFALTGNPDPESVNAVAVKRMWLRGEATDGELSAARDAAWDAAISSARDIARVTARTVAWNAAMASARNAARLTAYSTAMAVPWDTEAEVLTLLLAEMPAGEAEGGAA